MTLREQSRVFGEVAEDYDAIRSGYPPELRSSLIDYAWKPGPHGRDRRRYGSGHGVVRAARHTADLHRTGSEDGGRPGS